MLQEQGENQNFVLLSCVFENCSVLGFSIVNVKDTHEFYECGDACTRSRPLSAPSQHNTEHSI